MLELKIDTDGSLTVSKNATSDEYLKGAMYLFLMYKVSTDFESKAQKDAWSEAWHKLRIVKNNQERYSDEQDNY